MIIEHLDIVKRLKVEVRTYHVRDKYIEFVSTEDWFVTDRRTDTDRYTGLPRHVAMS